MSIEISGIHTTKPRTQRYVDAFVAGTPGGKKIYHFREMQDLPKQAKSRNFELMIIFH